MEFVENSTHQTFLEQHTTFGGGSSSTSRNQSNAFIQPSGGPVRYLREHESGDTRRHVNFLRNNIDPQSSSLVIGESVAISFLSYHDCGGDSIREVDHRDDPIVIKVIVKSNLDMLNMLFHDTHTFNAMCGNDSKQNRSITTQNLKSHDDEHDDAQQDEISYYREISYESVISKLLKQIKYQSTKMKNSSDSCCISLGTSDDGGELGKINCGHEFHFQCIRSG
ncbi:hypothetical protein H5410_021206 [Solanum commersonii]|uniref:RING-type E3 ubiquitin transferase n=1 Tax=Solanum commersonii TaxID=4109 RepID=A0A9J5ZBZ8_SOLCO|nr:hypothetical protein H5410_021206 [Solanum commersonii]